MAVKCLQCYGVFEDHVALRRHQPDCGPFVGAVWDSRSNLTEHRALADGGEPR